jgi:hypothetical protein
MISDVLKLHGITSGAGYVEYGYSQVEPNHLSAQRTGQIYAQLPAGTITTTTTGEGASATTTKTMTPIDQLEQGQFAKYDYAAGEVNFDGEGEFMLVYNEEKLYDERKQHHKDFVSKASDFTDGEIYPRLIRTYIGDIYTTNSIKTANTTNEEAEVVIGDDTKLKLGAYLTVNPATGFLDIATDTTGATATDLDDIAIEMVWKVVKVYTMPDTRQVGFKLQRVR